MSLHGIKLVTFDVTNTLLKFKIPPWQYYTIVAKDHGFQGNGDDIKTNLISNMKIMWKEHPNYGKSSILWEKWWSELVKMTFKDHLPARADIDSIASKIIDDYRTAKCWYVAEGCDKLLKHIKTRNIPVGIISNFDPRLYEILRDISLYKDFDFILTSYDVGYSKPDERIFKSAISMCKKDVKPSEALHIGDDLEKDYEGARAAGWHAILINANINTETPPAPQHVFNSLEMLYTTIEQEKLRL